MAPSCPNGFGGEKHALTIPRVAHLMGNSTEESKDSQICLMSGASGIGTD